MNFESEQQLVAEIKRYVTENLPLSQLSDDDLQEQVENIVAQKLGKVYCSIDQRVSIVQQVYSSIRGFGLLDTIISDDTITEVMINGHENVFIEQNGRLFKLDKQFESQRRLEDVIQRIVGLAGREVNQANPICDTRLPDGSRVNVVLPPISLCGPILTIRKFSKTPMTIEKLIQYGSITQDIADKLELLVKAKYNIFISGGTGSGKTTFLNALSNFIPKDERIITIEDSAELQIKNIDNLVSLETRNANLSNPSLMKEQVVEFMKYRAPIELTTSLIERLKKDSSVTEAIESSENEDLVEDKKEYYEAEGELLEVDIDVTSINQKLMAVFRVEKVKDYTVMSNHHLRNTELSLKAKGLMSLMLSLPEDWDYTLKGLACICRDGVDSISRTIKELEDHGYLTRRRFRYPKRSSHLTPPSSARSPTFPRATALRFRIYPSVRNSRSWKETTKFPSATAL